MTTRWNPDTCNCVHEYNEIDANGNPVWTKTVVCDRHANADETIQDNRNINKLIELYNRDKPEQQQAVKGLNVALNQFDIVFGPDAVEGDRRKLMDDVKAQIPRLNPRIN